MVTVKENGQQHVQILNKAVCISLYAYNFGKDMYQSLIGKIVDKIDSLTLV